MTDEIIFIILEGFTILYIGGANCHSLLWRRKLFEIPAVNQTQVEVEEKVDEEKEKRNDNVVATNERGMELLYLLRETETIGPVRDVGPVLGTREKASTDNLAEVSSDGNGESREGRVSVFEIRVLSSSGANGEEERTKH